MSKQSKSSTTVPTKPQKSWEQMSQDLMDRWSASGLTEVVGEQATDTTQLKATFVPRRGEKPILQRVPEELCEACGTPLDAKGRCRACWADVMGICEICDEILEPDHSCKACGIPAPR
jgi:hypothetical protein